MKGGPDPRLAIVSCVVCLVHLVDLVCFVYLVDRIHLDRVIQRNNQTDQTNQITVFVRWRAFSASC
jgi:hypothetical protein